LGLSKDHSSDLDQDKDQAQARRMAETSSTSSNEVNVSSSGSVKMHVFQGEGKGVTFQEYYNRLESALEFNYLEQTIKPGFVVPKYDDA